MKKWLLAILLAVIVFPFSGAVTHAADLFQDVGTSHRAYKEVTYLAEGEIVFGANGYFNANDEVTRAEAAAMLGRALNLNGTKRVTGFSDVGSSSFASGYIQSAVDLGIVSGYDNNTFKPNQPVKRGEMAILISRAFNYEGKNSVTSAQALMSRGIAQGYTETDFGYDMNIKRSDFSIFLARAINYQFRVTPTVPFSENFSVKADVLNVRSGPSTKYNVVGKLNQGDMVQASYRVGDWVFIRTSLFEGLVNGFYLEGASLPDNPEPDNPDPEEPTEPEPEQPEPEQPTEPEPEQPEPEQPPVSALSEQVIVIDPGHGGSDPGASGFGLQEKFVTLETALELRSLFAQTPFTFKLTRESDKALTLAERVAFAKSVKGNVFLSIHTNSFNGSVSGTETYYYNSAYVNPYQEDSKMLAEFVQKRMLAALQLNNRNVKHGDFHVIRENTMPAALVELAFIDQKTDNEKLASPYWRKEAAKAIYLGFLDYYKAKGFDVTALYKNV